MEVKTMFFDVKVLDSQGETKRIISGQELSRLHWKTFQSNEENKTLISTRKTKISRWGKKKLDMEFSEVGEMRQV